MSHKISIQSKATFTRQTKVGKLVLANSSWRVWTAQKQSANTLANCWRQIELAFILANFFAFVNSYLTCEQLANVCWYMSTNQNKRLIHVIWVTLYKMADEREDREATFQFIEEIQNCPDLWKVLFWLQSIKTRKTSVLYAPRVRFLLMYGFVQTFLLFSALSVSSSAINIP